MALADEITVSVSRNTALPLDRLRLVSRFDELPLPGIRRGIVYFLAPWSGPSVMYFGAITAALSRMDCSNLQHVFHLRAPAGAGETLWVRDTIFASYIPKNGHVKFGST